MTHTLNIMHRETCHRLMKHLLTLLTVFGLTFAASAASPFGNPQIGKPAPDFSAKDIDGKIVKLSDFKGRIVVIEAHEAACPWTQVEYQSGAMQKVQRQLASNDVAWLILNQGIQSQVQKRQTVAEAKKEIADQKMTVANWIIDDAAQSVSKRYGVRVSPQMFVIDTNGVLAYTGAPDDARTLAQDRMTSHNYVRQAVTELLAGKKVSVPHVKPIGCMIIYPGMSTMQLMTIPGDFN